MYQGTDRKLRCGLMFKITNDVKYRVEREHMNGMNDFRLDQIAEETIGNSPEFRIARALTQSAEKG